MDWSERGEEVREHYRIFRLDPPISQSAGERTRSRFVGASCLNQARWVVSPDEEKVGGANLTWPGNVVPIASPTEEQRKSQVARIVRLGCLVEAARRRLPTLRPRAGMELLPIDRLASRSRLETSPLQFALDE